jgi:hypothetical protein
MATFKFGVDVKEFASPISGSQFVATGSDGGLKFFDGYILSSSAQFVDVVSDQTIGGNKTFSAAITGTLHGDIDGNAATATAADSATSASYATYAASAGTADSAATATSASYATYAASAGTADSASTATSASYATYAASAGAADTATSASYADYAATASYVPGGAIDNTVVHLAGGETITGVKTFSVKLKLGTQDVFVTGALPADITGSVGDIYINTTPTAGGTVGWICTTAGDPGVAVWKEWGNISL